MGSLENIALDFNPSKFSPKAILYRTDLKQFFINSATYEAPNYVNVNEGITTRKFTADEIWNPITGLSSEQLNLVHIDAENATNGQLDIIVDGTVIKSVISGAVSEFLIAAPSTSLSIKAHAGFDPAFMPTARTNTKDVNSVDSLMRGLKFSEDGINMASIGDINNNLYSWVLSTPFEPNTAATEKSFSISGQDLDWTDIEVSDLGDKVVALAADAFLYEYTLSTNWDVSSATFEDGFDSGLTAPDAIEFSVDGKRAYLADGGNLVLITMTAGWDVSTSSVGATEDVSSDITNIEMISFADDGKLLFVWSGNDDFGMWPLATPYDVATRGTFVVGPDIIQFAGNFITNDGKYMFTMNASEVIGRHNPVWEGNGFATVQ